MKPPRYSCRITSNVVDPCGVDHQLAAIWDANSRYLHLLWHPMQVWLADTQALLDAATNSGGGGERTVRYLQTAIEDIAGALRRAWRLQPEVRSAVVSLLSSHCLCMAPAVSPLCCVSACWRSCNRSMPGGPA